jgi:hypothetical protein
LPEPTVDPLRPLPLSRPEHPNPGDAYIDPETSRIYVYTTQQDWACIWDPTFFAQAITETIQLTSEMMRQSVGVVSSGTRRSLEPDLNSIQELFDSSNETSFQPDVLLLHPDDFENIIELLAEDRDMAPNPLTIRRFEFKSAKTNKFWEIEFNQTTHQYRTRWGRIHSQSPRESRWKPISFREYVSLIGAKLHKGYKEVALKQHPLNKEKEKKKPKQLKEEQKKLKLKERRKHPLWL